MCFRGEVGGFLRKLELDKMQAFSPEDPETAESPDPPPPEPEKGASRIWEPLASEEDEERTSRGTGLSQLRIPPPTTVNA